MVFEIEKRKEIGKEETKPNPTRRPTPPLLAQQTAPAQLARFRAARSATPPRLASLLLSLRTLSQAASCTRPSFSSAQQTVPQLSASRPAHVRAVPLTSRARLSASSPPHPFPSSPSRQSLPLLRPPHHRRRTRCPWASPDLADPLVSFPHAPPFQKPPRRTTGLRNGRCHDPLPLPYHARNPRRDGVTHARPGSPPGL